MATLLTTVTIASNKMQKKKTFAEDLTCTVLLKKKMNEDSMMKDMETEREGQLYTRLKDLDVYYPEMLRYSEGQNTKDTICSKNHSK